MAYAVVILDEKEHDTENSAEDSAATADANGRALHTESCPKDCYRFVSRYLLKTHEPESSTAEDGEGPVPVGRRSAAELLKAA